MKQKKQKHLFIVIFMFLTVTALHAEYIEGIDTTDQNGYGLDNTFRIENNRISGKVIAIYYFDPFMCRIF